MWRPRELACFGLGALAACQGSAPTRPPCLTPAGVTTLLTTEGLGGLATDGSSLFVGVSGGLDELSFDGGLAVLSTLDASDDLLVARDQVFFYSTVTTTPPPDGGKGGTSSGLYALPLDGGVPTDVLPGFTYEFSSSDANAATDGTDLYFAGFNGLEVVTPPATQLAIPLDPGLSVDGIAVYDGWIYVAAQDISAGEGSFTNGVLLRVPVSGGSSSTLLSGLGHPWSPVVGAAGLFWAEDPPGLAGEGSLRRANLDGTGPTTLRTGTVRSLALAGETLVFGAEVVGTLPTSGGTEVDLASGLLTPQFLLVVGSNVVWADLGSQSLSGGGPQTVATACLQ